MAEEKFVKVCMKCESPNIKPFSADDNDVFGLNPKYTCMDCGSVGMPIEVPASEIEKNLVKVCMLCGSEKYGRYGHSAMEMCLECKKVNALVELTNDAAEGLRKNLVSKQK